MSRKSRGAGGTGAHEMPQIFRFLQNCRRHRGRISQGMRGSACEGMVVPYLEKKARTSAIVKCGGMLLILTQWRSLDASMEEYGDQRSIPE